MTPPQKIRVLIVDDSASVRQTLKHILENDPEIEVMGVASDPFAAVEHIKREVPDVITREHSAIEIITKPKLGAREFFEESQVRICDAVKSTAQARLRTTRRSNAPVRVSPKLSADAIMPPPASYAMIEPRTR